MNRPIVAIDARLVAGRSTGDSTYWTALIGALAQALPEFQYLLFSNADAPSEIPLPDHFRWITLPSRSQRWWSYVQFPLAARKAGARAIHTQYSMSPLVGRIGITTIHDVSFFIGPQWFRPRDRTILRKTTPLAANRAAAVITVSETSKGEICRFIPAARGKTHAIPLACPPWIRPIAADEARAAVASLNLPDRFILTVGARWPRKNMTLAVQAVAAMAQPLPLVVTGKPGWGEDAARRAIATGYVSSAELSALYSLADMYLAPSLHEGFGLPILEAFTCGCPVLCSSGGAFPETAGDAAEVEPTWDPVHWAATLQGLLADSSKLGAMRERGRRRAAQFTWAETARRTIDVYRRVVE